VLLSNIISKDNQYYFRRCRFKRYFSKIKI